MNNKNYHPHTGRVGLTLALLAFMVLGACQQPKGHTAPAIHDRDSVSMMTSYGVNTLISDSGVIRYRIVTERWDVNVIKQPTRWTFEKGIFLEQFDQNFHVEGYIYADSAWYFDQKKLWKLRGRVRIRNVNGLQFRSEELFWDGITHEFYSHKFSKVITPEREMQGTYFRSDEHMTRYEITNSVGSFQQSDMDGSASEEQPQGTAQDSVQAPPLRQPTVKRASTNKQPQP